MLLALRCRPCSSRISASVYLGGLPVTIVKSGVSAPERPAKRSGSGGHPGQVGLRSVIRAYPGCPLRIQMRHPQTAGRQRLSDSRGMALGPGAARPQGRDAPRNHQHRSPPPTEHRIHCSPWIDQGTSGPRFLPPDSGAHGSASLRLRPRHPGNSRQKPPNTCTAATTPTLTCIRHPASPVAVGFTWYTCCTGQKWFPVPWGLTSRHWGTGQNASHCRGGLRTQPLLHVPPWGWAHREPCPALGFRRMCSSAQGPRSTLPP